MSNILNVTLSDEISRDDAVEFSKDIRRMIRRAREAKSSRMFIRRAAQNLASVLEQHLENPLESDFEDRLEAVRQHREDALRAIRPYTGFFNSHGLLPSEVSPDAHLLFILVQMDEIGVSST